MGGHGGGLRPAPVFCAVEVSRVAALTPHLVRITLVDEDLVGVYRSVQSAASDIIDAHLLFRNYKAYRPG